MKVLILGGTGMLGTDIAAIMEKAGHDVIVHGSQETDITGLDCVIKTAAAHKPQVIINSAAITDVDKCEAEPDNAYRVNAIGPKNAAIACRKFKAKLVHISTDYVFDGEKGSPYTEFDAPNPVNIYGKSKLLGEDFVKSICNDYCIIRVAWLFGTKRSHFVDYVADSLVKGSEIIAVKDMVSSPTYAADAASMISKLAVSEEAGTFHSCNKGYCSRVQLVEEIMKITNKKGPVKVVNQSQWLRLAKRPAFSALKNHHLGLIDKDEMAGWRDALKRYMRYKLNK
ncbi:MAG TPA: dTDP-4-dehydrorhamnose reductase [bacterium]|nr:dTDP-4-dehydrorhamnose reductase [bacterium]